MDDLDEVFSNFSVIYDTNVNITDVWSYGVYGKKTYLIRAVLSLIAVVPNLFFIAVFVSRKTLWTKINLLICHLMVCNVLFCAIYTFLNFVKFRDSYAPEATGRCLALTWFTVIISFGPSWAVTFMLFSRAISNIGSKYLNEKIFSLKTLILIRLLLLCLDAVLSTFIVLNIGSLAPLTHCTYHYMLDRSKIYLFYNFFIGAFLITAGAATLVTRFILRYKILKQIQQNPNAQIKIPSALWTQPKYIVLFILVSTLFLVPRGAFIFGKSKDFWLIASICPLTICFIFPILFFALRKCFRITLIEMFSGLKKRCTNKISPSTPTPTTQNYSKQDV